MKDEIDYFHVAVKYVHEYFKTKYTLLLFPISNIKVS